MVFICSSISTLSLRTITASPGLDIVTKFGLLSNLSKLKVVGLIWSKDRLNSFNIISVTCFAIPCSIEVRFFSPS